MYSRFPMIPMAASGELEAHRVLRPEVVEFKGIHYSITRKWMKAALPIRAPTLLAAAPRARQVTLNPKEV